MAESFKRQTAYKFWIKDILLASSKRGDEGFLVFNVKGKEANRVNVLASIIDKYENDNKTYVFITLDDGSGRVRVKVWNEDCKLLSSSLVGSMVLVVGRLALSTNNEVYLRPEIVKKLDNPAWYRLRKIELEKEFGKEENLYKNEVKVEVKQFKQEPFNVVEEEVIEEEAKEVVEPSVAAREKVFSIIEKNGEKGGIEISKVVKESGVNPELAEKAIKELIQEGEIFQTTPGKVQVT